MKRKSFILFIVCFLCVWSCEEFVRRKIGGIAGSYPFVESWKIKAPEAEVLEAIKELKKEHSTLQSPNSKNLIGKRDTTYNWISYDSMIAYIDKVKEDSIPPGLSEVSADYWLFVTFYYRDTKEEVFTWTRPDVMDSSITTIALIGVGKIDDSTDNRKINRDFWYVANKLEIRKFKKNILQPILDKIEERKKRNSTKI